MNFYNNKLNFKEYIKVIKNYKAEFSKEFIIKNYGMLIGDKSFYRTLACFELLLKTKKIKGDIIEFGIWNGNNLFTLKKIIDFLDIKKKLYGYDNFLGFPNPSPLLKKRKKSKLGEYAGDPNLINYIIKFFNLKNIKIINNDILNLKKYKKRFKKISFIYIDCDVYEPVTLILNELIENLSIGGIIAFDEANKNKLSGEAKALKNFLKINKHRFKKVILKKNYQPDVYIIKIR